MDDIKNDPRFAHIISDPKFRRMPKSKRKVKIDSRFRSVFSSKHFSHKTDIDKRGRPILDTTKKNKHVMQRFYDISDDDEVKVESDLEVADLAQTKQKLKKIGLLDSRTAHPQQQSKQKHEKGQTELKFENYTRKQKKNKVDEKDKNISLNSSVLHDDENGISGSDILPNEDEDSPKDTSDDDDDDEMPEFTQEYAIEETKVDHKWSELHTDAPMVVESTHRLAVCNMDWDFIKAQDLFVLFKSFVPDGGRVRSVTIYPSEFGKERMAEEARLGPREIREQSQIDHMTCDDAVDNGGKKKKKTTDQQRVKRSNKDLEASQTEKLREYQLNRLRYYFAVVDCDSVSTAEMIYNECDGREYLLSSVRLDLRFIPDDMTFDDCPKDTFSQEQSILEYEPNRFSSTALCQAKVDVTWDETDFDRLSHRMASLQQKELEKIVEENKYADIIAPPESDTDEDVDDQPDWLKDAMMGSEGDKVLTEEDKIAIYRRLLVDTEGDNEEEEEEGNEKDKDEKEFVWQPGLKSSLVKKMQKKERKQENTGVVNDYLEKKKEKKRKKKEERMKKKASSEIDRQQALDGDVGVDAVGGLHEEKVGQRGPAQTSHLTKKKKKRLVSDERGDETEGKSMADLELLVMEDTDIVKQKNTDDESSNKRKKKLKKKKKKLDDMDDFLLDVNDPRFAALYTSHHFHLDPTASQFKKTKNMSTLMNEQIRRRGHLGKSEATHNAGSHQFENSRSLSQSLVESLKVKMRK